MLIHGYIDGLVSSSGDSLDSLIERTMKRVCSELDSTSSPVRIQAFTLMILVRITLLLICLLLTMGIFFFFFMSAINRQ